MNDLTRQAPHADLSYANAAQILMAHLEDFYLSLNEESIDAEVAEYARDAGFDLSRPSEREELDYFRAHLHRHVREAHARRAGVEILKMFTLPKPEARS